MKATALLLATAGILLGTAPEEGEETIIAIRAGTILPVSGDPIRDGVILLEGGKILALGEGIEVPEGATELSFPEGTVIPGLVSAYSTLAEGGANPLESVNPAVQAIDGFDFFARRREILSGGVTTVYISPGNARLLSGQGAVVRLAGGDPEERILRETWGVQVNLGEAPKKPPTLFDPPMPPSPVDPIEPARRQLPSSRLGAFFLLRKTLGDESAEGPIAAVRQGKAPVFARCHAARDIRRVLDLAKEVGVRVVVQGGAEAGRLTDLLGESHATVVLQSPFWPGSRPPEYTSPDPEAVRADPAAAAKLVAAGVSVALIPPADSELPDLLVLAARARAAGLADDQALRSITITAAEILGVEDRVGSLEPGKDADLVILSGGPFETRSTPRLVISGGDVVYKARPYPPGPSGPGGKGWTAIRAGRILTVSHGEILNGTILMEGGKIRAVGRQVPVPDSAEVIDASDSVVVPGFIDVQSRLGLPGDEGFGLPPGPPLGGPAGGKVKASRALVLEDPAFRAALVAGVTTAVVTPGGRGSVGGQAVAVKCGGGDLESRILRDPAGIRFNLTGGSGKLGAVWSMRNLLKGAKEYAAKRDAPPKEGEKEVKENEDLEPLRALLKGEIPAFVRVQTPTEILTVLEVFADEFDIRVVLIDAEGSHLVTDEIRSRAAAVAAGPGTLLRVEGEWVPLPLRLAESGIPLAFQSGGSRRVPSLPLAAAYAVRHGLDESTALRALTLWPAQMAGIQGRVGSIEVGKDADLLILSGDPMDLASNIQKVLLEGEVVYEK